MNYYGWKNPYKNSETLAAMMWLCNDKHWTKSYLWCLEWLRKTDGDQIKAASGLAKKFEVEIKKGAPFLSGLYGDLLAATIDKIDFLDIANTFVSVGYVDYKQEVYKNE